MRRTAVALILLLIFAIFTSSGGGTTPHAQADAALPSGLTEIADCPTTESQLSTDITSAGKGGTVDFNCSTSTTITFTSILTISQNVTLEATGEQGTVTFEGEGTTLPTYGSDFFSVDSGATLGLNHVILQNASELNYAILNSGSLTIANSTFTRNDDGAISNSGTVTITSSTFSDNWNAIFNTGTVIIASSTFSDNFNEGVGGAIVNSGAMTMASSTFSGNYTLPSYSTWEDKYSYGGAIWSTGTLTVANSTFSGNSASYGGAISGTNLVVRDGADIFANNDGGNCSDGVYNLMSVKDLGYNLDTDGTCLNGGTGDITGIDPKLNSLADNGGPTQTMALQSDSPAIDQVPASSGYCPAPDQRGVIRPDGRESSCDMGAYEYADPAPPDTSPPTTTASLTPSAPDSASGWYVSRVHLTLYPNDPDGASDVASTKYSTDGGTTWSDYTGSVSFASDGQYTVLFYSTDKAGNRQATQSVSFKIDQTPPRVTGTPDRSPDHNGWYNHPLTVTWTGDDGTGSGVASCDAPSTYTSPDSATVSVTGHCSDEAGNLGSGSYGPFPYDATKPTVSAVLTPASLASTGWHNIATGAPTVSFLCSDATSGIDGSCPSSYTFPEGQNLSHFASVSDKAGNTNSAGVSGINVDLTPPTCTVTMTPITIWPPNHKMVAVTAQVTVNDALSGPAGFVLSSIASNEGDISSEVQGFVIGQASTSGMLMADRLGTGTGRVYTLTYTARDKAGNTATCNGTVTVPHDQGH